MPFDFTGKKILVTGAGRGIGLGAVRGIMKGGGEVYALSKTQSKLDNLVEEFPDIHAIQIDLSDWNTTRTIVDEIETLDGLVNNAGILKHVPSLEASKTLIDDILSVNLMAAINITQSVGKKMVAAGKHGSIVNISSMLGINPWPKAMAYSVSKAGLDMVTKQFALELGPHGIRVNSVNPTVIPTDMTAQLIAEPEHANKVLVRTPMGRFGEVEECANLIMFLLSDESSMITGTTNPIDGGLLANVFV